MRISAMAPTTGGGRGQATTLATVTVLCLVAASTTTAAEPLDPGATGRPHSAKGSNGNARPVVKFPFPIPAAAERRNASGEGSPRPHADTRSPGGDTKAFLRFPHSPDLQEMPRSFLRKKNPYAPKDSSAAATATKGIKEEKPKAEAHSQRRPFNNQDDYYDDDYGYDYDDYNYDDYDDYDYKEPLKKTGGSGVSGGGFRSPPKLKQPGNPLVTKARLPSTYRTKQSTFKNPSGAFRPPHVKHPKRRHKNPPPPPPRQRRRRPPPNPVVRKRHPGAEPRRRNGFFSGYGDGAMSHRRSPSLKRRPLAGHRPSSSSSSSSHRGVPATANRFGVGGSGGGLAFASSGARRRPVFVDVHDDGDFYDDDDYYYDDDEDYYEADRPMRRQGYGHGVRALASSINPLALVVAPLAGIALLTAAAGVALNPMLVSVSLTQGKKRRRRSVPGMDDAYADAVANATSKVGAKVHDIKVLERYLGSVPEQLKYQQQILSMYLGCSGYTEEDNKCLDRVVCEYSDKRSTRLREEERDVVAIVLYNIMGNEFVSDEYKERLRRSARVGRDLGGGGGDKAACVEAFACGQLDDPASAAFDDYDDDDDDGLDRTFDDEHF